MNINRQFKALIRPLSSDEYEQLEQNLLDEGCRDPLVVWGDTLLDGHNRYEICTKHGIDYRTVQAPVYIRTDEDAEDWIDKNQLGRRNLTREEFTLIVGRRYNRRKKGDGERGPKKLDQNEPASTAEIIAAEHGISPATVKRAGKFAEAVDTVKETEPEVVARGEAEILKRAREIQGEKREAKRQEIISKLEDIQTKQAKAIEGVYDVIVIDPPWPMQKIERDVRPNQSEFDYPTMQESELAEMKIPSARPQGNKTELTKIIEGWGDYMFYGFADPDEESLCCWFLGDLKAFRLYFNQQLYLKKTPWMGRANGDGSSEFMAFERDTIPDFIIAQHNHEGRQP